MARTVPVQIYVPDDLLDAIDDHTDNRSEYFRELAEEDLSPRCESCGATGEDVSEYYLGDEDGYLGHPAFCDQCYGRAREEHHDDDIEILPVGAIADA